MQHSTGQYDDLARVPRARPREGCRRRTTASRHRRHSPPRCSCRVIPPIRDTRLVDLNLAVFMCNSVARQERVCRAQRPAAKIDAIATSASGRDRTSVWCTHFIGRALAGAPLLDPHGGKMDMVTESEIEKAKTLGGRWKMVSRNLLAAFFIV